LPLLDSPSRCASLLSTNFASSCRPLPVAGFGFAVVVAVTSTASEATSEEEVAGFTDERFPFMGVEGGPVGIVGSEGGMKTGGGGGGEFGNTRSLCAAFFAAAEFETVVPLLPLACPDDDTADDNVIVDRPDLLSAIETRAGAGVDPDALLAGKGVVVDASALKLSRRCSAADFSCRACCH
jgi:hypothetical protein